LIERRDTSTLPFPSILLKTYHHLALELHGLGHGLSQGPDGHLILLADRENEGIRGLGREGGEGGMGKEEGGKGGRREEAI